MNDPLPRGERLEREWLLAAPPERVWPLVSDTNRLNALLGNPPVRYEDLPDPRGGIRRQGAFTLHGVPLRWDELPYEWIEGQEFGVRRDYHGGPFAAFGLRVTLASEGAATRLRLVLAFEPRNAAFRPLVRVALKGVAKGFDRIFRHLGDHLAGKLDAPFDLPPSPLGEVPQARVRAVAETLFGLGLAPAPVEALIHHVLTAPDDALGKMRPFELAKRWGVERRELLKVFLHATKAGLLELKWDLLCPGCRGAQDTQATLSALAGKAHCAACNIDTTADFSQSVELSFKPNRAVRHVERREFCMGSPSRTEHVVLQARLDPEASLDVELGLEAGTYRLRSPQVPNALVITLHDEAPDAGARHGVRLGPAGFAPAALDLSCRTLRLRLEAAEPVLVVLERLAWADNVVTGAYVSAMQEFRALFSSEVLSGDLELGIARLAIMFTDLKSSTAMYEQLGDATAFRLVQAHFRILEEAIAANHGAIVKTVGDAVMACFYDAADCVRAALEIQASIDRYNAEHPAAPAPIVVKLGAHVGPCIAVTLNERLDYFGTTVNMAARVQNEATGGDIVLSGEILADPGVSRLLESVPIRAREAFEVRLKGLVSAYELTRIVPDPAAEGTLRRFPGNA